VRDLPGDARKWGSVGFTRGSKFATGFSPLAPKSLESIIDVERAKGASSEELSALWNELIFCHSCVERRRVYINVCSSKNASYDFHGS